MESGSLRQRNRLAAILSAVVAVATMLGVFANRGARLAYPNLGDASQREVAVALASTSMWWACLALAVLAAVAAVVSWHAWRTGGNGWIGPDDAPPVLPAPPPAPRWFWPVLLGVLVLGFALRVPRMTLGFYNDESHTYVRYVAGEWREFGTPGQKFRQPRWSETAFRNTTGNNSFLFSLSARACFDAWQTASGAPDGMVKEWPTRVPSLLAGLATLVAAAAIGRRCGRPGAGMAAALFFALHPWHIRYSTEARGYALMMLFVTCSFLFLIMALQSGDWREWLLFGVTQFLTLWANLGSVVTVAETQLGVLFILGWLIWRRKGIGIWNHAIRWMAGGVPAVLLTLALLTPGIIQLQHELHENPALLGTVNPSWWRDTLVFLANGCGWGETGWDNPINPATHGHPLRIAGVIAFYGLVGMGFVRAWKAPVSRTVAFLAGIHFLSLGLLYARSVMASNVLMSWYALPALPGLLLLAGAAFSRGLAKPVPMALACLALGGAATGLPVILTHAKSDGRGLVRLARGGDFPTFNQSPRTLVLWADTETYDPLARWVENPAQLEAAGLAADAAGVPLFVYTGQINHSARTHPEVLAFLDSPAFELVQTAWALESSAHDNRIYRWKGNKSAAEIP